MYRLTHYLCYRPYQLFVSKRDSIRQICCIRYFGIHTTRQIQQWHRQPIHSLCGNSCFQSALWCAPSLLCCGSVPPNPAVKSAHEILELSTNLSMSGMEHSICTAKASNPNRKFKPDLVHNRNRFRAVLYSLLYATVMHVCTIYSGAMMMMMMIMCSASKCVSVAYTTSVLYSDG